MNFNFTHVANSVLLFAFGMLAGVLLALLVKRRTVSIKVDDIQVAGNITTGQAIALIDAIAKKRSQGGI